jgi:hypothetical protein
MGALPAFVSAQGHAVPRGGEGSSSGSSGGGDHSSGSSHGSSSGSSSSGSSDQSSSGQSSSPRTGAESRHPRPGTGTGDRFAGRNSYYYGSPYYYGRQYYSDAFDPFYYGAYGYSPFYYSGSYGYAPYYYRGRYRDSGSMRVIVDPDQTRVYVDGYYAGIADDFDGILQRLTIPPGRHEITLKLDGYRTHKFRVYVPVGETIKIHHVMERGTGEDTDEVVGEPEQYRRDDRNAPDDRAAPPPPPPGDDRDDRRPPDARDRDDRRDRDDQYGRRERERDQPGEDDRDDAEAGTVRLDLRPPDASVYVDGEFRGAGRRVESLRLAPGHHRLEIVRPGFHTVDREIDVRPGETTRVQIDLGR